MDFDKLLGVVSTLDLSDPDALHNILMALLSSIDWWWWIWFTVISIVVGALIGWYKGAVWRDMLLGAALGPIGWIVSVLLPGQRRNCLACGRANRVDARCCDRCGAKLLPAQGRQNAING